MSVLPRALRIISLFPRARHTIAANRNKLDVASAPFAASQIHLIRQYSDHPNVQQPAFDKLEEGDVETKIAPRLPTSIKQLNKQLATRESIDLPEEELEEKFVRGSGPGGQSINKTSNAVSLIHLPTGIRIQCQETRSLQHNRRLARRILRDKVELHLNPGASKQDIKWEKARRRKSNKAKKSKRKYSSEDVTSTENGDMS